MLSDDNVAVVWAATLAIWLVLSLSLWIVGFILLVTLPALWDIFRDRRSWLEVHKGRLTWASALNDGDRSDIDNIRINRRFDGGYKITLIHVGGAQTRLPPDVTPQVGPFESALAEAGIAFEKHPFSPF